MIDRSMIEQIVDGILKGKESAAVPEDKAVRSYNEPLDLKDIDNGVRVTRDSGRQDTRKAVDKELAALIDHTLLKPDARLPELEKLCQEAMDFGFASVCVNSAHVPFCYEKLRASRVALASVIGFPLGAASTEIKRVEAAKAIADGADELDMVINIGWLKSGRTEDVYRDILAVVKAAHGKVVKVILETSLLSDEEIIQACVLAKDAGAHFVKTSTGFSTGGAKVEHVALMRKVVGKAMGVKASGGVRSREDALAMIKAGANRLGTSSGIAIVTGGTGSSSY